MKIPQNPPVTTGADTAKPVAAAPERALLEGLSLREGQATLARVLEQGASQGKGPVRLMLEIGGMSIPVDSETELQPGTLIRLQRAGNSLRLLETLSNPSNSALNQALAQKLPAQFDIQAGLRLIASLSRTLGQSPGAPPSASPPNSGSAAAPGDVKAAGEAAQIRSALTRVMSLIPPQSELQGTGAPGTDAGAARIKTWIQNSGVFTEARLAVAAAAGDGAPDDLKSQLLRLGAQLLKTDTLTASADLRQLRPAVSPELVQQALQFPLMPVAAGQSRQPEGMNTGMLLRVLAGMINRITVNQLHSHSLSTAATADGSQPPQTWLLELPWLNPQQEPKVVQARIERREGERDEDDPDQSTAKRQAQWRLNLALDLDELGPVYFELALTRTALGTRIWAEREATWRLVDAQSGILRTSLGALGLEIKSLECHHGAPPQTRTRLDHRLVDEKA